MTAFLITFSVAILTCVIAIIQIIRHHRKLKADGDLKDEIDRLLSLDDFEIKTYHK